MGYTPHVTVVVGGQYGSEGKGAICGHLAKEFDVAVRVGGPNAGHTVWYEGREYKFRQLPVASIVNPRCAIYIGAGGLINLGVLREEMNWIDGIGDRLLIDRNAGIIDAEIDIRGETDAGLFESIGSTTKGVGSSLSRKIRRQMYLTAQNIDWLQPYIGHVATHVVDSSKTVLIEGTQGHGLSLNHGPYPYCTSRDVLSSSLLSDCGLGPFSVRHIILVIRTFPIRVYGNSGPMTKEISWSDVTRLSQYPTPLEERTTVTNRVRRVGMFDWDLMHEAVLMNQPTQIALNFADYLDYRNKGVKKFNGLTKDTRLWIDDLESQYRVPVALIKTGPLPEEIIDRRLEKGVL